jgi:hypothetical protein
MISFFAFIFIFCDNAMYVYVKGGYFDRDTESTLCEVSYSLFLFAAWMQFIILTLCFTSFYERMKTNYMKKLCIFFIGH